MRAQLVALFDLIQSLPAGPAGPPGPPGPSVATALIDGVNTLPPGANATVDCTFDGAGVHFTFGVPAGVNGTDGSNGQPGEVSNMDMANAINNAVNGTSNNTNGVPLLDLMVNDPPTQTDLQQVVNKLNELIMALRR